MKNWPVHLIVMLFLLSVCPASGLCSENTSSFDSLQKRLIADGFEKEPIEKIYSDPAVTFDVKGLTQYFKHREGKLNYDQFAQKEPIEKARQYMARHEAYFNAAEKTYGVDREVITAIMLVETRLGGYIGNRLVLNTLSAMAALADGRNRQALWKEVTQMRHYSMKKFSKWVNRRSHWAYLELKSFLTYTDREGIDPTAVVGSYAGAMGIAQFMPSNVLAYAQDGDQDGRVDLFTHPDAIASIASYLKHYGWKPGITENEAAKVVYRYNHSKYYVRIVLKITNILKG